MLRRGRVSLAHPVVSVFVGGDRNEIQCRTMGSAGGQNWQGCLLTDKADRHLRRAERGRMKNYLSYGGGVNSTALMFWLLDRKIEFEAVYSDHKTDYSETREYVQMLKNNGFPITVIPVNVEGFDCLYDYCCHYRIIPTRWLRWCTDKFKIRPLHQYFQRPSIVYIGIDTGESDRVRPFDKDGMKYEYPLVEEGIDRRQCAEIIKAHGYQVPPKSGCFICSFQRIAQWKHLRDRYPKLWCKALKLEKITNERLAEKPGGYPIYFRDKPLEQIVREGQDDLFGWRKPCQCGL